MKAPNWRRVYSKVDVGSTSLLTNCEIFINVTQQLSTHLVMIMTLRQRQGKLKIGKSID